MPTISYLLLSLLVTLSSCYSVNSIYHWSNKFDHTKNQASGSGGNPEATLSAEITLNSDCAFLSSSSADQAITFTGALGNEFTAISIVNLPVSANAKFFFTEAPYSYLEIADGSPFFVYDVGNNFTITFEVPLPSGKIVIRHLDCSLFLHQAEPLENYRWLFPFSRKTSIYVFQHYVLHSC